MTIAVTAAAGQLGHIVIDKLKQKVSADFFDSMNT